MRSHQNEVQNMTGSPDRWRLRIWLLALASISVVASLSAQVRSPASEQPSPDIALTQLVTTCVIDSQRPKSAEAWEQLVRSLGMARLRDVDIWELKSASGRLTAFASFGREDTQYWFVLFPQASSAIPDAVLSYLLAQSTFSEVQGDQLEIGLQAGLQSQTAAVLTKSITISLSGGRLLGSRTTITWKGPAR